MMYLLWFKKSINRRIAISSMSILAALSLMTGATFAYFSNSGTSTGNTFSTGTLDLKLSDAAVNGGTLETDQDSITSSFGNNSLIPGTCTGPQTLTLKNAGTVQADHAEVHLANVITDNGAAATPDMDRYLLVNTLTYDGGSVISQIADVNGDGVDLSDWAASATALDNLALTDVNVGHNLVLDVCLSTLAPNEIQGDSILSTFTVDLNQNSSQ